MASINIFSVVYLAVACAVSAAASSCGLDIAVSYPTTEGGQTAVSCTNQCPAGEDGFTITGVAFKRFPELDSYSMMVRVSYQGGEARTCSLVPLQSEQELTAMFRGCMQAEETTAAPVEPTAAPVEPTAAPVEPTAAPVEPTAAPVEPTAAPVEPTAAPVEPTAAPVEPTAAPVETTAAPVETTAAPVETTAAPVETTAALVAIRERCMEGFSPVGASCYLVTTSASSAPAGWQACAQYGGEGAVIETLDEQNLLAGVLSTRVWLAVNDMEEEGRFRAPGHLDSLFTRWIRGEPNNLEGNEDCVMLIPEAQFGWNDDNCQVSSRALCEHAPVPVYEEPTCATGQHKFDYSCYFFTEVGDFDTGAARCRNQGGYPAVVSSLQEQQFLGSIASETVYLGYTDRDEESVFASNFGVALYNNWNYGEPNNWNGNEDCVQMIDGWGDTWYDISCSTQLRMACEIPA
ncbi:C-type lectin-like [Trinorchestia longiramus]|nr:C-type lectin-like [Trinorchestia longiramus]